MANMSPKIPSEDTQRSNIYQTSGAFERGQEEDHSAERTDPVAG